MIVEVVVVLLLFEWDVGYLVVSSLGRYGMVGVHWLSVRGMDSGVYALPQVLSVWVARIYGSRYSVDRFAM